MRGSALEDGSETAGGVLLHNERRPALGGIAAALGLPLEQSRYAIIARVQGAPAPLFESVRVHRKAGQLPTPNS